MKKQTQLIKITAEILAAALFLSGCASKPAAAPETAPTTAAETSAPETAPAAETKAQKTMAETKAAETKAQETKPETAPAGSENGLKWWQKTNVCEIYVRSFNDSDGDGIGDLNGITEKLDYLKKLGVGAIWLTPCYKSPQADNGYDVADYYDIDPMFGTMEDMDRLIAEAGKRDIRIVMDLVFNHTSNENEWFLESESDPDGSKGDWYIWRDAKPDGSAPTNWRSIFGGSAWTWSEKRGQYYLHTFLKEQPDLNWENPEVRKALFDVANFWVGKGVGGFRMDAVTYIKKPEFKDGAADAGDGMVAVHAMTANTDGILDYLHEFKQEVQEGTDIFTVGEANGVSASDLPLWVGSEGVFDMVFEFSHIVIDLPNETDWSARRAWKLTDLKKLLSASQKTTAENGWYPIFFENHDQPRCIDHFFPDAEDKTGAAKVIGTLMYTLRGTPFLYQGQEIGMRNVAWNSIDDYNDISTVGHYDYLIREGKSEEEALEAVHHFSRDSARTPMQWSAEANAGFSTGTPWLPVSDDYMTVNAETEEKDPDSILSWYRALADLRSTHDVLTAGSYEEILNDSEQIYGFLRKTDDTEAVILANFSEEEAEYDSALVDGAELLISSAGADSAPGVLKPLECVVYEKKN